MSLEGLAAALEGSALAQAMRHSLWAYPAVEIVHIAGIVLLVGSVGMLDLRLLGFSPSLPAAGLARHVLPWTWIGFALVVPSGLAMFSTHATEFLANPALGWKLALIALAGVNAALLHASGFRTSARWDATGRIPFAVRAAAALSLALWLGVIACGRLIAYL